MNTRIPIWILLFGLTACELFELPMAVEPAPEALVVSSVRVGGGLVVTVTRSFSTLSGRSVQALEEDAIAALFVTGAEVVVRSPGRTDTLAATEVPGFYAGSVGDPAPGTVLQLSARDPVSGLRVDATTPVMPAIGIAEAEIVDFRIGGFDVDRLRVWIDDPDGANYYALHVYNLPVGGAELDSLFFRDSDLLLHSSVFTDRAAEDGRIRRSIDLDPEVAGDTLVAVLSHIDEGYYRYLDARRRTGGLVASLANEPISAPTNVAGGHGYFSAHGLRVRVVVR